MKYFQNMTMNATKFANDNETAQIRHKVGVSKEEFLKRLKALNFSRSESRELKRAMEESAKVFGYAGRN
jgi:hypothetical protein